MQNNKNYVIFEGSRQKYDTAGVKIFLTLVKECTIQKMHFCAKMWFKKPEM